MATVINKFMRHEDWLKQGDSDLCAAEDSASSSHFEYAKKIIEFSNNTFATKAY
jgi:hypothetical protein